MKESGIIYRIINKTNGKSYIGQTTQGLNRRRSEHLYRFNKMDRDHKLYLAFKKYGFDGFEWEVLKTGLTLDELNTFETRFIKEYDSYNHGYNMNEGGFGVSAITREKLRKIFTGRKITWAHKILATKAKRGGYSSWCKDMNGSQSMFAKKYIVTEPDGTEHIVYGLREWCRNWTKEKLHHSGLVECAKGRQKQTKGYKCRYYIEQRSTTREQSRTSQAIGDGNGEHPTRMKIWSDLYGNMQLPVMAG